MVKQRNPRNNNRQQPIQKPMIAPPQFKANIDTKRMEREQRNRASHMRIEQQRQEQLRRQEHQFDKSVNHFAQHDQQLKRDIQAEQRKQRFQQRSKTSSGPKIAAPDINVGKQFEQYGMFTPTNNPANQNPKLKAANAEYAKEQNKRHSAKANHRVQRLTRGSSALIRKYDNNLNLERLKRLVSSNLLNVYTNRLVHWISQGWNKQNILQHRLPANTFYNSTNKIYTNNSVKMPIILYSFPDYVPVGWFETIRNMCENVRNRYNREMNLNLQVSINHVWKADNSKFSFNNSKRLIRDYDDLTRQYERNAQMLDDPRITERDKKRAVGEDIYRKLITYEWSRQIAEADADSFWETREFIELVVSNGESAQTAELLRECYDTVISRLNILHIKYKDLYATIQNYYDGFSPIGHGEEQRNYIFKKYAAYLRSGEQIVSYSDLRQGTISDEMGVPVGVDIYSEKPMFINYADNNTPPSTFIFATSGSGKTYLVQSMLLGFLLFPDQYFPIIIDWKNEYVDLARSSGMQVISSSPVDGLYFSTIEIPAATGNAKIDERNKDNALRATESIFEILLGSELWNTPGIQTAFQYILQSLYISHGVYLDNPDTWKNSKGLTFHTFYAQIDRIFRLERGQAIEAVGGVSNNDEQSISAYRRIQETLAPYFERNGSRANFFKKAIRMEDINTSRGIVFALDRDQDKGGDDSEIRLNLSMQLIMLIINNLTHREDYKKRLLTIFDEETNRLLTLPKVAEMMAGFASSGRSRGIRNFFITNAPEQVFNAGDVKNSNEKFVKVDPGVISSIIANVGSVIVGPNNIDQMAKIAESYDLRSQNQIKLLELLAAQVSQDNSDDATMAHKFLIKHRGRTTLIEAISNPVLSELGTFGTETKVMTKEEQEKTKEQLMKELLADQSSKNDVFQTHQRINQKVGGMQLSNDDMDRFHKMGTRNNNNVSATPEQSINNNLNHNNNNSNMYNTPNYNNNNMYNNNYGNNNMYNDSQNYNGDGGMYNNSRNYGNNNQNYGNQNYNGSNQQNNFRNNNNDYNSPYGN